MGSKVTGFTVVKKKRKRSKYQSHSLGEISPTHYYSCFAPPHGCIHLELSAQQCASELVGLGTRLCNTYVTPPDMESKVKGFNGRQKKGMWKYHSQSLGEISPHSALHFHGIVIEFTCLYTLYCMLCHVHVYTLTMQCCTNNYSCGVWSLLCEGTPGNKALPLETY